MAASRPGGRSWLAKGLLAFALVVLVPVAAILVLEGGASLALFLVDLRRAEPPPPGEWRHTDPDSILGWVNRKRYSNPDEYGSGVGLTTNERGFRGRQAVDSSVPAGKIRVACSGDSFTLGSGVADADTWCARLGALRPDLETVNLGQPDYGLDQSFLWSRRAGAAIRADVHLFALVEDDFDRMGVSSLRGRAKPTLALAGDSLVAEHLPVARTTPAMLVKARRGAMLNDLRVVQLLTKVFTGGRSQPTRAVDSVWPVVDRMLGTMADEVRRRNGKLVLVYLPTRWDLRAGELDAPRIRVGQLAAARHIPFLDLTTEIRRVRPDSADRSFITLDVPGVPGMVGHYSWRGNLWVAREVLHWLEQGGYLAKGGSN